MIDYSEYIEYGDTVLRPRLKSTGWEIHKIWSLVEEQQLTPQQVIQAHDSMHDFLGEVEQHAKNNEEPQITVKSSENFEPPELSIEEIEVAIEFARENKQEINNIKNEQEQLTDLILQPPEQAHEEIQNTTFNYFNVSSNLHYDENGTPMVDFEYEEP